MKTVVALGLAIFACLHGPGTVTAKPLTCPKSTDTENFAGDKKYLEKVSKIRPVPLSGAVGCIERPLLDSRSRSSAIAGPMEDSITKKDDFPCMTQGWKITGVDALVAELMLEYQCQKEVEAISSVEYCDGKKHSYNCLVNADASGHSLRIGTALDGYGIYGPNVATTDGTGKAATDLDACGGRFGKTPDSNDQVVYYYMLRDRPPFTIGCFGNGKVKATLSDCRQAYPLTCGVGFMEVTTAYGTDWYDTDCPCYDFDGSNLPQSMKTSARPLFLVRPTSEPTKSPTKKPTPKATLSPTAWPTKCSKCTDEPPPFMTQEGQSNTHCSTYEFTAELCKKRQFSDKNYCEMTCFEKNVGYPWSKCCPRDPPATASPTLSPIPCFQCSDEGTSIMKKKGQTCNTYEPAWTRFCRNNRTWRTNNYCEQTCFDRGVGYTIPETGHEKVCCPGSPAEQL